jgi:CheY-like chemotaxis protein
MKITAKQLPRDDSFILVVDDDPTILKLVERILQDRYTVLTAADPDQALAILGQRKPALVLMDLMMPQISGIDLCMILKTSDRLKDVPVIFMTAHGQPDHYRSAYDAGAQMYLTKPFRPAQLLQMVGLYASRCSFKVTDP